MGYSSGYCIRKVGHSHAHWYCERLPLIVLLSDVGFETGRLRRWSRFHHDPDSSVQWID